MLVIAEKTPVQSPVHAAAISPVVPVSSRVFNNLARGQLSACVLPESTPTPEGSRITFVDAKSRARVHLVVGAAEHARDNPALERGFKAVALIRPARPEGSYEEAPHLASCKPPSLALNAASLERRNFALIYGIGGIHGPPLLDGGTVLLRSVLDDGAVQDRPTRVAVMMKGDMPGIAPGYLLVTPPQQQPLIPVPKAGWS